MEYVFPNSIEEAAIMLDRVKPGWENKIDVERLNMGEYDRCILGQLYDGHYNEGIKELFNKNTYDNTTKNRSEIFCSADSKDTWLSEINKRLNPQSQTRDFAWALGQLKAGKRVTREIWGNQYLVFAGLETLVFFDTKGDSHCKIVMDNFLANDFKVVTPTIDEVAVGETFTHENKTFKRTE